MEAYNFRDRSTVTKKNCIIYSDSSDDDDISRYIDPDYVKPKRQKRNYRSRSGEGSSSNTAQSGVTSVILGAASVERTVFSWMISRKVLENNQRVCYFQRRNRILEGEVRSGGIYCTCCNRVVKASVFEQHAIPLASNRITRWKSPYSNIFVPNTKSSLLHSMLLAWNHQDEAAKRCPYKFRPLANAVDRNDDACIICADGGDLICCDKCPSTFHAGCMGMQKVPSEAWICHFCVCKFCGSREGALYNCIHCNKKYHLECSIVQKELSLHFTESFTYCGKECKEVYCGLQGMVGIKNDLGDGISWSLLQKRDVSNTGLILDGYSRRIETNAKIAVAAAILNDIFLTNIDRHTQINMLDSVVYSRESDLTRINFSGFYVAVLQKNERIITVATIRVHGAELAEMPYIGTIEGFRNRGMSRILLSCIESILCGLKVPKLVIPSMPELLNMWAGNYLFTPVDDRLTKQLRNLNVLVFPSTITLQKQFFPDKAFVESNRSVRGVVIHDVKQDDFEETEE